MGAGDGSGLLAHGVLVVVHPDLEDMALDADGGAELLDGGLVVLLDAPPDLLREGAHLVLLLGGEFGAEALLDGGRRAHRHHHATTAAVARRVVRLVAVRRPAGAQCRHRERGHGERGGGGRERERRGDGRGGARQRLGGLVALAVAEGLALDLAAVEVAVAVAGRAPQRVRGAVLAAGHELAAPVDGMPANAGRVVLLALAVAHHPLLHRRRLRRARLRHRHHRLAQNLARLVDVLIALPQHRAPVPARRVQQLQLRRHLMVMMLLRRHHWRRRMEVGSLQLRRHQE
jgi:hypothetical protein